MKLLLLSCCAPCSCATVASPSLFRQITNKKSPLELLSLEITVLFYNPNIMPFAEYQKRLAEQKKLCQKYHIPLIEGTYDNEEFLKLTKGFEHEKERGKRCSICFNLRLKKLMQYAKEHNFDAVSSVLGASRYKNLDQVNDEAQKLEKEFHIPYIKIELRKHGVQNLREKLIKELNLYQQTYCGCCFSHNHVEFGG